MEKLFFFPLYLPYKGAKYLMNYRNRYKNKGEYSFKTTFDRSRGARIEFNTRALNQASK